MIMKKEYSALPLSMKKMNTYGFSWMDFVTAIPAPLFVVTSYKTNGKANACLQSWACFGGDEKGFYALMANVNKAGHMYKSVRDRGVCALNFPSADIYDLCLQTIDNNQWEADEITASGLTIETAAKIDAPRIKECFLNLECRYRWERDLSEGSSQAAMCLEVINISMETEHLDETAQGRYSDSGYLYNVHYPVNPESYRGISRDSVAVIKKIRDLGEY